VSQGSNTEIKNPAQTAAPAREETMSRFVFGAVTAIVAAMAVLPAQAETIKIGISKLIGYPGVPIPVERGYFTAEGLDAQMVFFDSAQPIAIAVASGDVEFGVAGMSASFYTLAGQGQLRLIASSGGDAPGFYNLAFVASTKAYEAGLKSVKELQGHSVAITQVGTACTMRSAKRPSATASRSAPSSLSPCSPTPTRSPP
jgi:ABC-type nitrate/sulfonate/bicarbonate transport system substrate-binding protein